MHTPGNCSQRLLAIGKPCTTTRPPNCCCGLELSDPRLPACAGEQQRLDPEASSSIALLFPSPPPLLGSSPQPFAFGRFQAARTLLTCKPVQTASKENSLCATATLWSYIFPYPAPKSLTSLGGQYDGIRGLCCLSWTMSRGWQWRVSLCSQLSVPPDTVTSNA